MDSNVELQLWTLIHNYNSTFYGIVRILCNIFIVKARKGKSKRGRLLPKLNFLNPKLNFKV